MGLLAILLTVVLFAAKVFGAVSFGWLIVFSPILLLLAWWLVVFLMAVVVAVCALGASLAVMS